MRFKIYFRKNLKMSPQKLAAQVAHVAKELGRKRPDSIPQEDSIIVLTASDHRFDEIKQSISGSEFVCWLQVDNGLTEVPAGTETCFGYIEE